MKTAADNYEDIIRLAHHVSVSHPQMPVSERAAQFSPFAALTGYEAAIRETERLTEARIELDEDMAAELDDKLRTIAGADGGTAGSFCHLFSAGREKSRRRLRHCNRTHSQNRKIQGYYNYEGWNKYTNQGCYGTLI